MSSKVFVAVVAAGTALALGLTAFILLRKAPPTLENAFDHPFGDPTVAATEEDVAALKILNGAEKAAKSRMEPTAVRFYEDVDLRYSHTNVYERYAPVIWEEMMKGHAATGSGTEAVARFIEGRKALRDRWRKLKAGPRAKPELEAFLKELPPLDGRRPHVEAWLAE